MSKQTAVEWLFQQIYGDTGHIGSYTTDGKDAFEAFEQAKAMEREQMIDAYSNGWHDGQDVILQQSKHIDKGGDDAGTQFYNETYK